MANVPGTFYTAETQRRGTTPVSPPSAVDDPIDPVNPSGPPVVPPVAERYASEAAMIADQLNQKSGYLYFDGTDTWWYLGTTTGTIADYEAFVGGGGVQSVTGDGVDNTDPDNPVLSFPTPAEIGAQDDLGTDINAALLAANVPSGINPIATMADVGGGGADTNAVHYNAADGKSLSEIGQAKNNLNIGEGANPEIITTDANISSHTKVSNLIIFQGATALRTFAGLSNGGLYERVVFWNQRSFDVRIISSSPPGFSFSDFPETSYFLAPGEIADFYFDGTFWRVGYKNMFLLLTGRAQTRAGNIIFNPTNNAGFIVNSVGGIGVSPGAIIRGTDSHSNRLILGLGNQSGIYTTVNSSGIILHPRSTSATASIRKDEKRLYDVVTVTTVGAINDQALTDAIFNYRFTAATSITGFGNGEIGRTIDIDNVTGATLTIQHENAGSIAANRIKMIGAADIVMPIDGKMTLKYCTGSRWELVSKNF